MRVAELVLSGYKGIDARLHWNRVNAPSVDHAGEQLADLGAQVGDRRKNRMMAITGTGQRPRASTS